MTMHTKKQKSSKNYISLTFSYASVNNVTVDGETVFRDALRLADSPFLSTKTAVADFQVGSNVSHYQQHAHPSILQISCI